MFNALSLGKKIGWGFGAVLLIMACLGGFAVLEMSHASGEAKVMAEEIAPEVSIAADAQQNLIDCMLAARSFGLTEDTKFKEHAEAKLAKLTENLEQFAKLAQEATHLSVLKSELPQVQTSARDFTAALKETSTAIEEMKADRVELDTSAQKLVKSMEGFYADQKHASDVLMKEGPDLAKLRVAAVNMDELYELRNTSNQIRIAAWKAQVQRDYSALASGVERLDVAHKKVDEMKALTTDAANLKQLEEIKAALTGYQKGLKELVENGARLKTVNTKRAELSDKLSDDLNKVTLGGVKGMTQRSTEASATLRSATVITTSGVGIAAVFGLALAFFITRSIVKPIQAVIDGLNQSSTAVAAASHQVSGASQEMARGASEQASSLEETSASLEEMASMTRQNADNALQANTMAAEASSGAESGVGAMQRMSQAIHGIKKSSDDTAKILKTIDEIAFQTNLLALNAAVEAARAGDAGKGFAVVAEEVRNLAQRSAEAAKNTATLIEESQKNADNGVRVTQEVGETLQKIVGSVKKLQQLNGEVSAASTEQSKGIDQVNIAVSQMDKVTQSNAASSEESASASEELSAQATEMADMVATLATIVSGAGANHGMAQHVPAQKRPQPAMHAPAPSRKQFTDAGQAMAQGMKAMVKTKVATSAKKNAAQVIPLTSDELSDF